MKLHSMLKFAFSALLLSAGAVAFAQGDGSTEEPKVVQLADGTQVTWSNFAGVINGTITPQGGAVSGELTTALTTAKETYYGVVDGNVSDGTVNGALYNYTTTKQDSINAWNAYNKALTDYNSANNNVISWNNERNVAKDNLAHLEKITAPWLTTAITNAEDFDTSYSQYIGEEVTPGPDAPKIYYTYQNKMLTVSFVDPEDNSYSGVNAAVFFTDFINNYSSFNYLYIYFGKDGDKYNYPGPSKNGKYPVRSWNSQMSSDDLLNTLVGVLQGLTTNADFKTYKNSTDEAKAVQFQTEIDNLTSNIDEWSVDYYTYTTDEKGETTFGEEPVAIGTEGANTKVKVLAAVRDSFKATYDQKADAYGTAYSAYVKAQDALDKAQKDYDDAVAAAGTAAKDNYMEVTLIADFAVPADPKDGRITKPYYNGTVYGSIDGKGHIITVPAAYTNIFSSFSNCSITNTAVNGVFSGNTSGAHLTNYARLSKNSNGVISGAYYNADGALTSFNDAGNLGNAIRTIWNVDIANNKIVPANSDNAAYVVYGITTYEYNAQPTKYYVNLDAAHKQFVASTITISYPENEFIVAETGEAAIINIPNVIYNNVCNEVIINDKQDFYCGVAFNAKKVTYNRAFKAGFNSLCLPFGVNTDMNSNIEAVCPFDGYSDNTFWFSKLTSVTANTPMLIKLKAGMENLELPAGSKTYAFSVTPKFVTKKGITNGTSFGTFMKCTCHDFVGEQAAYTIYGLVTSADGSDYSFRPAASTDTKFTSFRMAIADPSATPTSNAPRRLGIRDEFGNDITDDEMDSIKSVSVEEAAPFSVGTGVGEIVFTSEADYGKVEVYSLDGRVAALADVMAGTSTVNVAKGVYIVMGKKVMVK